MGEKPMGAPVDEEELDPMAAAGGINTTRSNIRKPGMADAGGEAGAGGSGPASVTGEPIPGIDVK